MRPANALHTAALLPHPATEAMPRMGEGALAALACDIRENGLREPIVLLDGKVLDGRNRLAACAIAGVDPRFVALDGCASPVAEVVSRNLHRLHLSVSQRALLAALQRREADDRRRPHENAMDAAPGAAGDSLNRGAGPAILPGADPVLERRRERAGVRFGISPRSVGAASIVLRSGSPDLVAAVREGRLSVSKAAALAMDPGSGYQRALDRQPRELVATAETPRIRYADPSSFLSSLPRASASLVLTRPRSASRHASATCLAWLGAASDAAAASGHLILVTASEPYTVAEALAIWVGRADIGHVESWVWVPQATKRGRQLLGPRDYELVLRLPGPDAVVLQPPEGLECRTFEALAVFLIQHCTQPGDLVIDPSAGAGDVLLAAARLGRRALGATDDDLQLALARRRGCTADDEDVPCTRGGLR